MTDEEIKRRVVESCYYRDRGRITNGVLEKMFAGKVQKWRVVVAMRDLVDSGKLDKLGPGCWNRPADRTVWLSRPWRKRSNEALGINFTGRSF